MELSLILIFLGCIAFAALLYYFIFIKKENDPGGRGGAGIITILFVIAPIILTVLFMQLEAENSLLEMGFKPHPSFSNSIGAATGTGKNPVWVFSINGETGSIIQFYKDPINHDSWSLKAESPNGLFFIKENKKMSILVDNGNVVFSLIENE